MVRGLEKFKSHFEGFEGKYTLIGGVACRLLFEDAGLDFRGTQDFEIVLIVEAMDDIFGRAIWNFIKVGQYEIREKSNGEPEFYRFKNPKDTSFPKEADAISLTSEIQSDMKEFLSSMIEEDIDLKNLHIRGKKRDILERIANVYGIDF